MTRENKMRKSDEVLPQGGKLRGAEVLGAIEQELQELFDRQNTREEVEVALRYEADEIVCRYLNDWLGPPAGKQGLEAGESWRGVLAGRAREMADRAKVRIARAEQAGAVKVREQRAEPKLRAREKLLAVLAVFVTEERDLTIAGIAREAGVARKTAYHCPVFLGMYEKARDVAQKKRPGKKASVFPLDEKRDQHRD